MRRFLSIACLCLFFTTGDAWAGELCRPEFGASRCLVMRSSPKSETLICSTSYSGAGSHAFSFGVFEKDKTIGKCVSSDWIQLEDARAWRGNNEIIACISAPDKILPQSGYIFPSANLIPRIIKNKIYLEMEYTYVSHHHYQQACSRLRNDAFTEDEREWRDELQLGSAFVELRTDEYETRPIWLYFDYPSSVPHLQQTPP